MHAAAASSAASPARARCSRRKSHFPARRRRPAPISAASSASEAERLGVRPWSEGGQGFCFVGADGDQLSLTIDAGPRRIGGYLWEEKDNRSLVFLGTNAPRGMPPTAYGDKPERNVVGLFERVGPFRYRLTFPWRGDSKLAVVELTPAPEQ